MTDPLWYIPVLKIVFFVAASIPLVYISRPALKEPRSHGFYRFFAWETILALIMLNLDLWFVNPLAWYQIISWVLLLISLFLVYQGVRLLQGIGKPSAGRADPGLYTFEKTTQLVTSGVYRFIRHPLYSSLLFLAWGVFFKDVNLAGGVLALVSSVFLIAAARADEAECIGYFGSDYEDYKKRTKMFIPFLF